MEEGPLSRKRTASKSKKPRPPAASSRAWGPDDYHVMLVAMAVLLAMVFAFWRRWIP